MDHAFQLILLPGLGADCRLFELQRREFPQLVVPAWIPPRKNESLSDYAARMAETVAPSRDAPLILGGVSFGGMLACEMARHLKPEAVVLIASCRTRRSLPPIFGLGRWLLPLLPMRLWNVAKLLSGPVVKMVSRVPRPQREMLVAMFKEMDSDFMHWVLQAILRWEPAPLVGVRVFQIHGRRDLLIPARRVEADQIIPDGGHMINVTHADQVNLFITRAGNQRNSEGHAARSQPQTSPAARRAS